MSSSSARTGKATSPASYSFTLVDFVGSRARRRHTSFATLPDLAIGAFLAATQAAARTWYDPAANWPLHHLQAYGPRGETFDACELVAWGRRLNHESRPVSSYFLLRGSPIPGYVRRHGPVPGIHKLHSYRWHRSPKTMNERRANAAASCGQHDGEPFPRACRTGYALPSDRDDINRSRDRSWKAQHKGRKSWDR